MLTVKHSARRFPTVLRAINYSEKLTKLMVRQEQQNETTAYSRSGVLFEACRFAPGSPESYPRHVHQEYQIYLSLDTSAEYDYRGEWRTVPGASLFMIHSGEAHAARSLGYRQAWQSFRLAYPSMGTMKEMLREVSSTDEAEEPFFADPLIHDRDVVSRLVQAHAAPERGASELEQDCLLYSAMGDLILRHAQNRPSFPAFRGSRPAVRLAKEYLQDNLARGATLKDLSNLTGLSSYHLNRTFKEEVGVPPHAYLTQARIDRAKALLTCGMSPVRVAQRVGFYDQSHFGCHFRRLVGTTPARYGADRRC